MTLRVSEVYLSVQGEGPNVGTATVFVRFGGCNLRCPGWPCDTPYAIDPAVYRNEWQARTPIELAAEVVRVAKNVQKYNVCLTGGEPFLQKNSDLEEFVKALRGIHGVYDVECFSNGTLIYPKWAIEEIDFVMDWKLFGSGEDAQDPKRIINLSNLSNLWSSDSVKFVIKDRTDYEQAKQLYQKYWTEYDCGINRVRVYYGVVWGALELKTLVEWVLEDGLPWFLNIQIHNYIWDRTQRGI